MMTSTRFRTHATRAQAAAEMRGLSREGRLDRQIAQLRASSRGSQKGQTSDSKKAGLTAKLLKTPRKFCYRKTQGHTDTHTHRHTQTHRDTDHTDTQGHTDTHVYRVVTHRSTDTQTTQHSAQTHSHTDHTDTLPWQFSSAKRRPIVACPTFNTWYRVAWASTLRRRRLPRDLLGELPPPRRDLL